MSDLCNAMDYSLSGSSVHGILQARILEWAAIPFSRGSSQSRHQTQVSHIAGGFFYQLSHKGSPSVSVKLELNPPLPILTHWHLKTTAKSNDFYLQEITGNIYCFSSVNQWCTTLWDAMDCSMPGFPVRHQLPELTQTHVLQVGEAIQPSHPLLSPSPPISIIPSIRVFSNESVLYIMWPKYWSFTFSISPSNDYSGLISFGLTGLISVQSKGLSRVFSPTPQF